MTRGDPLVVGGSIDADIPYVFDLERNPTEVIKTGDYVKVNGDKGTVEIMSK
jgi:predicted aconitase with swiveling domain